MMNKKNPYISKSYFWRLRKDIFFIRVKDVIKKFFPKLYKKQNTEDTFSSGSSKNIDYKF